MPLTGQSVWLAVDESPNGADQIERDLVDFGHSPVVCLENRYGFNTIESMVLTFVMFHIFLIDFSRSSTILKTLELVCYLKLSSAILIHPESSGEAR